MKKSNKLALGLFLIYLAAVAYCCFGSFDGIQQVSPSLLGIPTDKIIHFIMFFPFPVLCYLSFDRHTDRPWQAVLLAGAALAFYKVLFRPLLFASGCIIAAATEIGQSFLKYRSCDIKDFFADSLALVISTAATLFLDIRKMKKR